MRFRRKVRGSSGGGTRSMLTPANFQYVRRIATPYDDRYFNGRGRLTGRIDGGVPKLLFLGREGDENVPGQTNITHVLEMEIPLDGTGQIAPSTTDIAFTETHDWGDPGFGYRLTEAPGLVSMMSVGHHFDPVTNLLWGVFGHWYGTPAHQNPSVFAASLNGDGTTTTYGPWRGTIPDWSCAFGSVMAVPDWFQTAYGAKRFAVHGARMVQFSHAGMNLFGFDPISTSSPRDTPFDWSTGDTSRNALNTFSWQSLIHHPGNSATSPDGVAHPQPIPGAAKYLCEGGCPHPILPIGPGGVGQCSPGCTVDTPFPIAPYFNGVGTSMTGAPSYITYDDLVGGTLDTLSTAGWIDVPSLNLHGILAFGFIQTGGHGWYGSYVRDPDSSSCQINTVTCFHGLSQVTGGQGTGMCATQIQNQFALYNPDDVGAVLQGTINPWELTPDYFDLAQNLGDNEDWDYSPTDVINGAGKRTTDYFGPGSAQSFGSVFPMEINGTTYVFVAQNGFYIDGGNERTTIHIFKIVP
jgi:hypothetical protein